MFPALCPSYFPPVRLPRSATVGTSVFHQALQCSTSKRLCSLCAGPDADALAPIQGTRRVMQYSVRPCRKTFFHGLPRVSSRRCVSILCPTFTMGPCSSYHLPFIMSCRCVPSCRRSGDSPLRRVQNSTGESPCQPPFQIFFRCSRIWTQAPFLTIWEPWQNAHRAI